MTRDQLIETMRRGAMKRFNALGCYIDVDERQAIISYVLNAIEAAGMRVVPVEMMQALREETAALLERYDDHEQSNHPHVYVLLKRLDAFLATMEKPDGQ